MLNKLTNKQVALYALEQLKGDDAERARRAFAGFSPDQMQLPHGQSGKSRQEILEGYQQHEFDVECAIEWAKSMPD